MRSCVANGYIISPANNLSGTMDLWIEDGRIARITEAAAEAGKRWADEYIDAGGKWVVPGLIDLHVHFREPGQTHKEDMESGLRSAARGGFTAVCCMPNTLPVIDGPEAVLALDAKGRVAGGPHALIVSSITKGQMGTELAALESLPGLDTCCRRLCGRGIAAISEDGKSVGDAGLMREAMLRAKALGLPVFDHAEPEAEIVKREIQLSRETGCPVHFCHISKKESVELIGRAKREGLPVTAETAPHYIALDEACVNGDPNRKMNPPLGTARDREAVLDGLAGGIIDAIATDHAPHHPSEKQAAFPEAPNGVIGLETSFGVCYTYLVKTGLLTPGGLIGAMSANPANILGLDRGVIAEGKAADLTVIDPDREWTVPAGGFASKAANTPFAGMRLSGRAVRTLVGGSTVYAEEG